MLLNAKMWQIDSNYVLIQNILKNINHDRSLIMSQIKIEILSEIEEKIKEKREGESLKTIWTFMEKCFDEDPTKRPSKTDLQHIMKLN